MSAAEPVFEMLEEAAEEENFPWECYEDDDDDGSTSYEGSFFVKEKKEKKEKTYLKVKKDKKDKTKRNGKGVGSMGSMGGMVGKGSASSGMGEGFTLQGGCICCCFRLFYMF